MEKRSSRGRPNKPCSPEFFKVFLPRHLSSPKILIPPVYIKHFSRTIKERITLKNESGKTWYVSVERNPSGFFISTGWQSFVSYSRLCVGNFLVFQYDSNYSFLVKIYGTDGCKRDSFGIETNATHKKIKHEEEYEEEEADEVEQNVVKRARVGKEDYSPSVTTRTKLSRDMNEVKKKNVRSEMPNDFKDFAKAAPTVP